MYLLKKSIQNLSIVNMNEENYLFYILHTLNLKFNIIFSLKSYHLNLHCRKNYIYLCNRLQ